jgi:tellurite resistance protein TerC
LSGFLSLLSFYNALDLGVLIKHPHYKHKEATKWTVIWVTISFSFLVLSIGYANNYISNPDDLKPIGAIKFITGYLIELSLSVDNIFVIAIIFSALKSLKNTNTGIILGYIRLYLLGINDLLAYC